jgi:hypothetical protein
MTTSIIRPAYDVTLRTIAIGALLVSLGVGMASNLLFLAAFQFRVDWFLEPTGILGAGETSAGCSVGPPCWT